MVEFFIRRRCRGVHRQTAPEELTAETAQVSVEVPNVLWQLGALIFLFSQRLGRDFLEAA